MTAPETLSRAGEDLSPSPEAKAATAAFLHEFNAFATEVSTKLQAQEDRMTKLSARLTHAAIRDAVSAMLGQGSFAPLAGTADGDDIDALLLKGSAP